MPSRPARRMQCKSAAPDRRPSPPGDVYLPRSLIMDKEVITRTSGKRLGYVNQLYVDPARLEVVSLYMRQGVTPLGATSSDHVLTSSLRQIGDVILVHDESALLDPPCNETYGYIPLVGTEVQTEDGLQLGKVRDYTFNPDNGQIVNIRFDALGIPSIPQSLLSCYSLTWQDIVAVGPTKTIVRRGAERRALKENDGWVTEYVTSLVNALAGVDGEGGRQVTEMDSYRSDPAYAAWYERHAAEYERYYGQKLPRPIDDYTRQPSIKEKEGVGIRRRPTRKQPAALPPPRSPTFRESLQAEPRREQEYVGGPDSARNFESQAAVPRQRAGSDYYQPSTSGRPRKAPQRLRESLGNDSDRGVTKSKLPNEPVRRVYREAKLVPVEPDAVIPDGMQQRVPQRQPAEIPNTPDDLKKQERPPFDKIL